MAFLETHEQPCQEDEFDPCQCLKDKARWTQTEHNRVARCLKALGCHRFQARTGDKRVWKYRRPVTTDDGEGNFENVTTLKLVTGR